MKFNDKNELKCNVEIDLCTTGDIYFVQFGVCFSGFGIKVDDETELLRTISYKRNQDSVSACRENQRKYLEKESQKKRKKNVRGYMRHWRKFIQTVKTWGKCDIEKHVG